MRRDRPLFRAASNEPCIRRSRRRVLGRRSPASSGERVGKRRRGYESAPPVVGLRSGAPGADPALVGEIAQEPSALLVRPRSAPPPPARWSKALLGQEPDPAFLSACHGATGANPCYSVSSCAPSATTPCGPAPPARPCPRDRAERHRADDPAAPGATPAGRGAGGPGSGGAGRERRPAERRGAGRDGRAPGRRPGRAGAPPGPAARAGRMIRTRAQQEALDAAVAAAVEKAGAGGLAR